MKLIKPLAILFLLMCMQCLLADDTEIFLGTNTQPPDPKVLFIFDNSGSMNGGVPGSSYSRMSVAKKALLDIVHDPDNSDLDIGLMLFNNNTNETGSSKNNGARVVFAIQDLTSSNRGAKYDSYDDDGGSDDDGTCSWSGTAPAADTLTQLICNILSTTYTPLEESMYEAYLYYKGEDVYFGNQNQSSFVAPGRDLAAESSGNYISPVLEDASFINIDIDNPPNGITIDDLQCQQDYIVLMTDGAPSRDTSANNKIHALDHDCSASGGSGECLDEMTKYMFENDLDNDSGNDKQHISTYTIGFTTNQSLLQDAATKGGGQYYTANNANELKTAFEDIFASINDSTASFASPSSSSSSTNDSQSLDYIYSNVFKPESTPKWSGNLKKYRLDTVQNGFYPAPNDTVPKYEFKVVDVNNKIVYDENGQVISLSKGNSDGNGNTYDVKSIWSSNLDPADTDIVELGGAGDFIGDYANRYVYTNSDITDNPNLTHANNAFNTSNTLLTFSQFNAADDTEKNTLINWARGQDTKDENDNGSTTDTRWVMGDILHSKPAIINYGKRNNIAAYTGDFSDIRIATGTNAGFLHFFKDDLGGAGNTCSGTITAGVCSGYTTNDGVSESWSFIPTEQLSKIKTLNTNNASIAHPYGVDGEVAVFKYDYKQDGNIVSGEDKVIIVFGMRRGGDYYYAIDVTDPDNPVYLWKFTNSEMWQSWSKPQFGEIKYFDGTNVQTKSVAIVTAGYDTDKDVKNTVGSNDDNGRGLFILDLYTGGILWSVLYGTGTSTDATVLYEANLNDSIPATPRTVDINDDGILDRIYMGDTGGNVWRIDLFNQDVETAYNTSPAPTYNSRTPLNLYNTDSRFKWSIFKLANLGRGDTNNLANDRRFFNQVDFVQTRDVKGNFDAVLIGSGHRNNPNDVSVQNRFYMLKDPNVIAYKFQTGSCESNVALNTYDPHCKTFPGTLDNADLTDVTSTTLSSYTSNGWKLDLTSGEKNLSSSVTINGSIYFTTFSPANNAANLCSVQAGSSYFYAVDLHTATASHDFNENGTDEPIIDRKKSIQNVGIPDKPSLFSPDGKKLYINPGLGEEPMYAGDLKTQIHYWFKNSE